MTPEERKKKNFRMVIRILVVTWLVGLIMGVIVQWAVSNLEVGLR